MKRIAITGGGTGGHVYPALAVYEELKKRGYSDFYWIGSSRGMERNIIKNWDIPYYGIPSGKLRRYISLENIIDVFRIAAGFFRALRVLIKRPPDILFSKGGYVSVPPVIAAKILKIPVVSHESDADPGLATKINARFSDKIAVPYSSTKRCFPNTLHSKITVTGNPIRSDIQKGDAEYGRKLVGAPSGKRILLVMGGSQGARQINTLISEVRDSLTSYWFVVHQMGRREFKPVQAQDYFAAPYFSDEYAHLLRAADLVVSRSGAGALWECAAAGKPMVLIPLLGSATRGDQAKNADIFEKAGAAIVLSGSACTPEAFIKTIHTLWEDTKKLQTMAEASACFKAEKAAAALAKLIENTMNGR